MCTTRTSLRFRSAGTGTGFALSSLVGSWITVVHLVSLLSAQTEGDTGYDYDDAYDDSFDDTSGLDPAFDVPIVNVTVVAGQTALLPCSIDYLGKYKVAWLDHKSIPLTYEDRRVVDDFRFSVVRPYIKEWNLQIRDIKWEDQGTYRCTINTNPVRNKKVMLHVKVPSTIIDELSSNDITVQEGDTVTLICNVTGVPKPVVTWYRRSALAGKSGERTKIKTDDPPGEMIIIQNVTRYCDDIYECEASNGVPPSVSRQMRVTVEFAPEIQLPNRRMGQIRGRETILECIITAYPQAQNYWEKDGKRITSTSKYRLEAYDEGDNTLILSLRINDIDNSDYGEYKCVASNALGRDEETMYLYEYTEADIDRQIRPSLPTFAPPVVTYSIRTQVTHRSPQRFEDSIPKMHGSQQYIAPQANGGCRHVTSLLTIGLIASLTAATSTTYRLPVLTSFFLSLLTSIDAAAITVYKVMFRL